MSESGSTLMRVPLSHLAEVDPEVLPENTSPEFNFKYVDIASVTTGRIDLPARTTTFAEAPSRARMKLRAGDVLMSTVRPNLKAFAQCRFEDAAVVASTGFAVIRARAHADSYFLLCAVLSSDVTAQIERVAVGSNYPAINIADVQRLLIPNFSLGEQRSIGAALRSLDNAIEATEALIEKHQQIKAGLMHDLFTRGVLSSGSLRPARKDAPDQYQLTKAGWIPIDWLLTTCEAVCESVIDCKNRTPPEAHDGFPVIRTPNVRHGEFVDDELVFTDDQSYTTWTSRGKPRVGDVVITREAPVGEVCMIPARHANACLGQRTMLYRPNSALIDPRFFLFALQSNQIQSRLDLISGGSTVGHVRVGDIRTLWMFQPMSLSEQVGIAEMLHRASQRLTSEMALRNKLRQQKLGLMQDLLTGKVRVQLPEPANFD